MIMNIHLGNDLRKKIIELADSMNSSFYIYETNKIKHSCRQLMDINYDLKSIHFAMMANSNRKFLEVIQQEGLNVFVNSVIHLDIALSIGFEPEQIIYAASAMNDATMKLTKDHRVNVVLDSLGQFNRWNELFPQSSIGIRCNIGDLVDPKNTIAGYFIGENSRLGLSLDSIEKLKGNANINGLHVYVGTNITDVDYFFKCYQQIIKLAEWFPELEYIDFGGGFGIGEEQYIQFDMKTYGEKVTVLMKQVNKNLGRKIKLILEPGRIVGVESGYFVARVVDVKHRNNHQLIGVNASVVQFPRPLFYPDNAFHPINIIHTNGTIPSNKSVKSVIYGCSTYSRDFLAHDVDVPTVHPGDIVVFGHAGSYCASAHTEFLGFPKAKEFFV
jgi:diaminopimelate decarboxylase